MGEPVHIVKLAEELIRLSGLIPYEDIDISFTGLRPGEKLFEEINLEGEGFMPTTHAKIKVLSSMTGDPKWLNGELEKIFAEAKQSNVRGIVKSLRRIVPEFKPVYHFKAAPSPVFKRMRPDIFPVADKHGKAAATAQWHIKQIGGGAPSPPCPLPTASLVVSTTLQ
jgi:hypothetical protein